MGSSAIAGTAAATAHAANPAVSPSPIPPENNLEPAQSAIERYVYSYLVPHST
jgi:hypothetical protein